MSTAEATLTAAKVLHALKQLGITHVVWLPDTESGSLYEVLREDPDLALVPVAREGESFAIAAGLMVGGKRPVVVLQSTGFFESGDSVRGIALDCQLPLLMVIGYRGYTRQGPPQDSAAVYLEPVLKAWGIHYYVLDSDDALGLIARAYQEAQAGSTPVAVLVAGEYR